MTDFDVQPSPLIQPPPLFAHQRTGVAELVKLSDPTAGRVWPGCFFLADQMRLGKSRCVVEAAQELYVADEVDQVIVIAPAPARSVWYHPLWGQIAQYSLVDVEVSEFRAQTRRWRRARFGYDPTQRGNDGFGRPLTWVVTNYEFARRKERLDTLLNAAGPRTILVLDEAMAIKSPEAAQTKALYRLRQKCGRVWLLDGTPEGDTPGDQYAPFKVMDPRIIGCENWYQFRDRYAVMGGFRVLKSVRLPNGSWQRRMEPTQIVKWVNLDDLSRRTAPYILRRTMDQVFDLPPKLDPVVLTATLSPETWRIYQEMRRDCVAWLGDNETASAAQAATRVMRLAQITSGFVGGIENESGEVEGVREIGSEKLDVVSDWVDARLREDPAFKVIFWCRFRAEVERLARALQQRMTVGLLYGGMDPAARDATKSLLYPKTAPSGPVAVVGTARTGGFALNLAAASTEMYVSNDWSRVTREQSEARILGPDQKQPAAYFDVVAEGPKGQQTVDHTILKALRDKRNVATLTAAEWRSILVESEEER